MFVLAVVMLVGLSVVIFEGRRRQVVAGWAVGMVALAELLAVDEVRDRLDPPFLDPRLSGLSLLCLFVGIVLTGGWAISVSRAPRRQRHRPAVPVVTEASALLYRKEEGNRT